MSANPEKYDVRRVTSSYATTIVSVALVLFMLGILGLLVLHAKKLSDYVKENISLTVVIKDEVKLADLGQFQKMLDASEFVKSTEYITKEQAARVLQQDLGEDFISFLGYNPLLSSIDLRLNANYANADSLRWIERELLTHKEVKEVFYQKSLVDLVNDNVKKIGTFVLIFSSLLLFISIALINNSIRVAIYAKRFIIKTMQLVGATQRFIRMPFIYRSILHGIYGALIAIAMLVGVVYFAQQQIPELIELQDVDMFAILFGGIILFGIAITWISTFMAVRKYLRLKTDDLYY